MRKIFYSVLAVFTLASCAARPDVAIISTDNDSESAALRETVAAQGFDCTLVGTDADFSGYDIVWYHRSDTGAVTAPEIELGTRLIPFVEAGGKLILTMDAVRLSHAWGIEPNEVETWEHYAEDGGFGRKVGYHANRSHPLFDKMFGGAYVWHGSEDNSNRVLGYTGANMPAAQNTGIIATLWEYIFYHPTEKVIWEQALGKGSILSIGCFLYYTRDNFNRSILDSFTGNVIRYMAGARSAVPARLWTCEPAELVFDSCPSLKAKACPAPTAWDIESDPHALRFTANRNEVTLPSSRSLVVAEEKSGIKEIWTHPFMSLRDYSVIVNLEDGTSVPLTEPSEDVELRFNSLVRTYGAGGATVREILVPSVSSPAVVAHYEWDGSKVRSISVSFSTNLRFMWPYEEDALGSIHCGWSDTRSCYVAGVADSEFVSILGSNLPGRLISQEQVRDLLQARVVLEFDAQGRNACDVVMAAGNEGLRKAVAAYDRAIGDPEDVFDESEEFWEDYLESTVSIETPDELFNEGYRWAMVSAGQFLARTPGLGSGLMAGYSSSLRGWGGGQRVSGRPGYAWYFGRDAEISALAFLSMGDFDAVRQTLDLMSDFQGVNGTIFHELTTSGSDHFDASDATPLYVVLMAEYLKATGDRAYIRKHIGNVYKAMDFCKSTDTDGDHLIEIQHVGHGWLEGGDYFMLGTEYYLSGIWARALQDASMMASLCGDDQRAREFAAEYGVVRAEIENFWNAEKGYYNYAKDENGNYSTSMLALPSVPVWLGVSDPDKAYEMVCKYAGADFSTDWGVRQTNDPRPEENVGAYDECNIWPLFTGTVSSAEYKVGRYNQGFEHIMASLLCYRSASHGRVPEVLRGNSFKSGGITRHQCWSETAVTGPAIYGMVGYSCNALEKSATLAPHFPADWDEVEVGNLRCGRTSIDMDFEKKSGICTYSLESSAPVEMEFAPAFPPASRIESVTVNGKTVEFEVDQQKEYTVLRTSFRLSGEAEVRVKIQEGASALPLYFLNEDNAPSSGIRVLSQRVEAGDLMIELQGRKDSEFDLPVYSNGRKSTVRVCFDTDECRTVRIRNNNITTE